MDNVYVTNAYKEETWGEVAWACINLTLSIIIIGVYTYGNNLTYKVGAKLFNNKAPKSDPDEQDRPTTWELVNNRLRDESSLGRLTAIFLSLIPVLVLLAELEEVGYSTVFNNGIRRSVPRAALIILLIATTYRYIVTFTRAIRSEAMHSMQNGCGSGLLSPVILIVLSTLSLVVMVTSAVVFGLATIEYSMCWKCEITAAPIMVLLCGVFAGMNLLWLLSLTAVQLRNVREQMLNKRLILWCLSLSIEILLLGVITSLEAVVGFTRRLDPNINRFYAADGGDAQSYYLDTLVMIQLYVTSELVLGEIGSRMVPMLIKIRDHDAYGDLNVPDEAGQKEYRDRTDREENERLIEEKRRSEEIKAAKRRKKAGRPATPESPEAVDRDQNPIEDEEDEQKRYESVTHETPAEEPDIMNNLQPDEKDENDESVVNLSAAVFPAVSSDEPKVEGKITLGKSTGGNTSSNGHALSAKEASLLGIRLPQMKKTLSFEDRLLAAQKAARRLGLED